MLKAIILIVLCVLAIAAYIVCKQAKGNAVLSIIMASVSVVLLVAAILTNCLMDGKKEEVAPVEENTEAAQDAATEAPSHIPDTNGDNGNAEQSSEGSSEEPGDGEKTSESGEEVKPEDDKKPETSEKQASEAGKKPAANKNGEGMPGMPKAD